MIKRYRGPGYVKLYDGSSMKLNSLYQGILQLFAQRFNLAPTTIQNELVKIELPDNTVDYMFRGFIINAARKSKT